MARFNLPKLNPTYENRDEYLAHVASLCYDQEKTQQEISEALDNAKYTDIALVGIGALHLDFYNTYCLGYVTAEEVENIVSNGVARVVCVVHFKKDGTITGDETERRAVGVSYEDLKGIPTGIGVAGDVCKAEALPGVLNIGLINVLVTDETAVNRALDLHG